LADLVNRRTLIPAAGVCPVGVHELRQIELFNQRVDLPDQLSSGVSTGIEPVEQLLAGFFTGDDPTARKCMRFAESWAYGRIILANLLAYRSTDPRELKVAKDPIGPDNDHWLARLAMKAEIIMAAWVSTADSSEGDSVVQPQL
jgi:hypothetical protein